MKNALYVTKTVSFQNATPQNLSGAVLAVVARCTNPASILGEISLELTVRRSRAQFAVDHGMKSAIVKVA